MPLSLVILAASSRGSASLSLKRHQDASGRQEAGHFTTAPLLHEERTAPCSLLPVGGTAERLNGGSTAPTVPRSPFPVPCSPVPVPRSLFPVPPW
jgi:hypothetical protein